MGKNVMVKAFVFVFIVRSSAAMFGASETLESRLVGLEAKRMQLQKSIIRENEAVFKSRLNGLDRCHSRALCSYEKKAGPNPLQASLKTVESEIRKILIVQLNEHDIWGFAGLIIAGYADDVGDTQ